MHRKVISIIAVLGIMVMAAAVPALSEEKPKASQETPKVNVLVDLKTQDCRTLLRMSGDERDFTLIFYHGFMSGMKNDTIFNGPELAEATDQIIDHCIDNPNDGLLKVFQAKRK